MPQSVIDHVHHLATAENSSDGLTFRNRLGQEFAHFDDDDDAAPLASAVPSPFPDFPAELLGVTLTAGPVTVVVPDSAPTPEDPARLAASNVGISLLPPAASS